jgi:hypothetical protein
LEYVLRFVDHEVNQLQEEGVSRTGGVAIMARKQKFKREAMPPSCPEVGTRCPWGENLLFQ